MSVGLVVGAAAAFLVVAGVLHLWTIQHHNQTGRPNWTLLEMCNCLCVLLFALSLVHLYKRSHASIDPFWGMVCTLTLVYFFSFFGVSMVHSVLEDGVDTVIASPAVLAPSAL